MLKNNNKKRVIDNNDKPFLLGGDNVYFLYF